MQKLLLLTVVFFTLLFSSLLADDGGAEEVENNDSPDESLYEENLLLDAAMRGSVLDIDAALADNSMRITASNDHGWNAVMFAVEGGHIAALYRLAELGCEIDAADDQGITPLMKAASYADKETVTALLELGADVTLQQPSSGNTAYDVAQSAGRQLISLMIAEAELLAAFENGSTEDMLTAINKGAFVDIRSNGWTPLIFATYRGEAATVQELLRHGANVNIQENDGWTALHFAAVSGHEKLVTMLRKAGADASVLTNDGKSAYSLAEEQKLYNIMDLLPADMTSSSMKIDL